jgi:hypothetical protein
MEEILKKDDIEMLKNIIKIQENQIKNLTKIVERQREFINIHLKK